MAARARWEIKSRAWVLRSDNSERDVAVLTNAGVMLWHVFALGPTGALEYYGVHTERGGKRIGNLAKRVYDSKA